MKKENLYVRIRTMANQQVASWWLIHKNGPALEGISYGEVTLASLPAFLEVLDMLGLPVKDRELSPFTVANPKKELKELEKNLNLFDLCE